MNPLSPTLENLQKVASQLRDGKLAILPTETVYGLAADAKNPHAVGAIFALKGRPAENPLIVHVSSIDQIEHFAASIPDAVHLLASAFMPGPLTLVLPKRTHVSSVLTGGLDSVAIRMPDHPACLGVMELGGLALAMPSANPFMGLSPTNVDMIDPSLISGISFIIDGGPCTLGIESTVLDLTGEPTVLRPGSVTREEIEGVLQLTVAERSAIRKAPGMYKRHYAPRTQCLVVTEVEEADAGLVFGVPKNSNQIQMPSEPRAYASLLYASMADLDGRNLSEFYVQLPPITEGWTAVMDRLSKATS
jgi:L-threonylcarbamoyladenylate synthase